MTRLAVTLAPSPAVVTQPALFDLSAYVGRRRCLYEAWLARQLRRKPRRSTIPPLPAAQLRLEPCKALLDIGVKLRGVLLYDALACGNERVEYVALANGGYHQVRWYRGDRIIGVGVVYRDDDPEIIKTLLAPVLYARGWQPEGCCVEKGAAWGRRRTRRSLPR